MTSSSVQKPFQAVIMAGGKGTRLLPHTADTPKPLVEIGRKPVIDLILRWFGKCGATKLWLALGHRAEQVMQAVGDGSAYPFDLEYVVENEPRGTVGALKTIKDLPENFIVANSDVLSDIDLRTLFKFHLEHKAALTVATTKRQATIDYGVLTTDADQRVTEFIEKPGIPYQVSMGIYVFNRDLLDLIPDMGAFGFDQLLAELLRSKREVYSYPYEGYWLDIGKPEDYDRAQTDAKTIMGWL